MSIAQYGGAALGIAAGVTMLVAMVEAIELAAEQRYWSAGLYRLVADALWQRFDRSIAIAGAVAVASTVLVALIGRWRSGASRVGRPRWLLLRRAGLVSLAVVAGLRGLWALDAWRVASGPNVILISIDTLRADRLGAYGYGKPTSPAIDDRLAAAGVTFARCYSQSPKTTPSHMTMLTSLYPCVHGVALWEGAEPGPVLSPAVHTLAEILGNAGYATGAFTGRGHVHRSRGFGQGFDVYVHDKQYKQRHRYEHSRQLERALQWMDEHRDRKFFLFLHTYAVHDPYVPPSDVAELFDDGGYTGPARDVVNALRSGAGEWEDAHRMFWDAVDVADPHAVRFVERLYDAAIRHMDRAVMEPLLDRVDALGLHDRTLVVLTSDHGEAFGEHGRFLHGDLHEETLRVPLILRFPGRLEAGQQIPARVRVIDVMPTILELVDVPTRAPMQGRSLVPVMRGQTERAAAASEFSAPADGRVFESLRSDDLSYIVDRSAEYLFDLDVDPGEHRNLLAERPAEAEAMRNALMNWRQDCRRLGAEFGPRGMGAAPSADTLRQLRALGYVN